MYKFAINRPITTFMLFLSLVIFGFLSLRMMNVNLFPNVQIPLIKIMTYSNGDLNYIQNKITKKIEDEVSGVSGISKITSYSYDNLSVVLVEFELSKNIEVAANDVRDKLAKIRLHIKPQIEKLDSSGGEVVSVFVSSKTGDNLKLNTIIDNKIKPFLERIKGVGDVKDVGFRKPEVRIFLNPFELKKYHLTTNDVLNIIKVQNFTAPLGKIENSKNILFLKSDFDAKSIKELKSLRILPGVFLSDVADVKIGLQDYSGEAIYNGKKGVILQAINVPGANSAKTAENIKEKLPFLIKSCEKDVNIKLLYDKSKTINLYLSQTTDDLILGVFLTAFIVFVFLRNFTSTIIAALAVPTSIMGTFFVMYAFQYDLNRLTLVALTLGIGIFVDDAIVVIENISKKATNLQDSFKAANEGTGEIIFSVLGISTVLLCVFIPMGFMSGIVGRYFNSFAISVACGIIVSFFVSIMLIPTLSARFLKSKKSKFYNLTEPVFGAIENLYEKTIRLILRFKTIFIISIFVIMTCCISLIKWVNIDFLPSDDASEFNIFLQGDPSWSYQKTQKEALKALNFVKSQKYVDFAYLMSGYDDAKDAYKVKIYVHLQPLKKRAQRQNDIIENLRKELVKFNLHARISSLPLVDLGGGENNQIQLVITGESKKILQEITPKIKKLLESIKGVVDIKASNEDIRNELEISLNKELAKRMGINAYEVSSIINAAFNSNVVSSFNEKSSQYDIVLRYGNKFRGDEERIKNIQIRTSKNELVSLESIASFKQIPLNAVANRYDRENEVLFTANTDQIALGVVKKAVDDGIKKILPSGYHHAWMGFVEYMGDTVFAFSVTIALSMLLVYMVLAALYESFVLPIIIMITMPFAFSGVVLGLFLMNDSFSLYVMVATILLFGMVGKNAILVVDFANRLCEDGLSVDEAVVKAGKMRLRAILMTTFAMIFAMLPLALSHGSGYEGNSPMAISVIAGLITSTILTLLLVPALFDSTRKFDKFIRKFYEIKKI